MSEENKKLRIARFAWVPLCLGMAIQSYADTSTAQTQSNSTAKVRSYQIPAGNLSEVLPVYAAQSGILLGFDPKLTAGKSSPGIQGQYSTKEGLNKLLEGSGLEVASDKSGGYFLQKSKATPAGKPSPQVEIELKKTVVKANRFKNIGPLPGLALTKEQIAGNIQTITAKEIKEAHSLSLTDLLNSKLQSVNVNDYQGNPFQMDVTYRGFTAGPQIGTPQGLSVFFDGIRVNEPFGDVVNWDLLPLNALDTFDIFPGSNPLFGLNTLGGALSMRTKSGFTSPGVSADILTGSFGRRQLQVSGGFNNANKEEGSWDGGDFAIFGAGNFFLEDGWRDNSPTKVNQVFGKAEWQGERASLSFSTLGAVNKLVGNGVLPQEIYREDAAAVFTSPDETKNALLQFQIAGAFDFTDNISLTGHVYKRNSHRKSSTGDIIDIDTFSNGYKTYPLNGSRFPGNNAGIQCALADDDANGIPNYRVATEDQYNIYSQNISIGNYDQSFLTKDAPIPLDMEQAFREAFKTGIIDFNVNGKSTAAPSLALGEVNTPSFFESVVGLQFTDTDGSNKYIFLEPAVNASTCATRYEVTSQYPNARNNNGMISSLPPTERNGARDSIGTGVIEGTPTGIITKSDIAQSGHGAALQLNFNFDQHKFMVGASIDRASASYTGKQRFGLLDEKRNVYNDPSKLGEEFYFADHDATINDFDGTSTTKSIYLSETWSPTQNLNFSFSARQNHTDVDNQLNPSKPELLLNSLTFINRYPLAVVCPGSDLSKCPYGLNPIPANVYWDDLVRGQVGSKFTTDALDKRQFESFTFRSFNPSLGATWQVKPNLNIYANWNKGTRAPSVIELGCAYDSTLVPQRGDYGEVLLDANGNPQLGPRSLVDGRGCSLPSQLSGDPYLPQVVAKTIEVGARGKFKDFLEWNVTGYRTDVQDDLYITSLNSELSFFQTIGSTRRQGIEFGLAGEYGKSDFRMNYSLTEATFEDSFRTLSQFNTSATQGGIENAYLIQVKPGNVMPGVPFNNFNFTWGYKLTPKLKMNWTVVAHSKSYLRGNENNRHTPGPGRAAFAENSTVSNLLRTPDNTYPGTAPGYATLNFNGRYDLGKGWSVGAIVNNVLDKKYFTAGRLGLNPIAPSTLGAIGPGGFNYNSNEWLYSQFISPGAPRGVWLNLGYDFDASKKSDISRALPNLPIEPDTTLDQAPTSASAEELALASQLNGMKNVPVLKTPNTQNLEAQASEVLSAQQAVIASVETWRKAQAEQDATSYINVYANSYSAEGKSRNDWLELQRLNMLSQARASIEVSQLAVAAVENARIVAVFNLIQQGATEKAIRKILTFEQQQGQWRIVEEQNLTKAKQADKPPTNANIKARIMLKKTPTAMSTTLSFKEAAYA